jgi:hypothetical protein
MSEFVLIKNNGMGAINGTNFPNCCIFISLGILWKYLKNNDYNNHKRLFEEHLKREVSAEEMVFSILKVKEGSLVENLGEQQIDTLIEKFCNYTRLKISVVLAENGMKWDLFKDTVEPDGVIVQYNNHFECALPRSLINRN